ncbi:MAG TPA: DUF2071 domain-containing protein [Methylomirabilota bacterium]|nr:DUF2071 domain-containing protein [Methylomirabilota bacterium]
MAAEPRGWVLYDGTCGICLRWVPFWAPTLARLGLDIAPLQMPWVAERLRLPSDALLTDLRLLLSDGQQLAGADVYRYVMRRLWWTYPMYLLAAAPGLRRVFDRAYRAFADNRHRVSDACRIDARRTSAPGARPFLRAEWRYLVMVNYEVDPAVLEPLVPAGTALDLWHGRALVSVVGFRFLATRVLGAAIPGHRNFDEVNLRFYVRREVDGECRRGVVFIRELVPRAAVAAVARWAYNEPYRVVRMRSMTPFPGETLRGRLMYEWHTSAGWQRVAATAVGSAAIPDVGTESAFVTQHHWGYTRQRDGSTLEYAVEHPPWRVWNAAEPELAADVAGVYGEPFIAGLSGPPRSAFVADGSSVTVSMPRRLAGTVRASLRS